MPDSNEAKREEEIKGANATVYTWGTSDDASKMDHYLKAKMKGGNVGHVSMSLTIPVTPQSTALIEKYCMDETGKTKIPFTRAMNNYQKGVNSKGEPKFGQRAYYNVYFSWWPKGPADKNAHLMTSKNKDSSKERPGTPYVERANPTQQARKGVALEQRRYHGTLGSTDITLSPVQVVHERKLTGINQKYFIVAHEHSVLENQVEAIDHLEKKLSLADNKPLRITPSIVKLLDAYIPNWHDETNNANTISQSEANNLLTNLQTEKTRLTNDLKDKEREKTELFKTINKIHDDKLNQEVEIFQSQLQQLPPEERQNYTDLQSPRITEKIKLDNLNAQNGTAQTLMFMNRLVDYTAHQEEIKSLLFQGRISDKINLSQDDQKLISENWRTFLDDEHAGITPDTLTEEVYDKICANAKQVSTDIGKELAKQLNRSALFKNQNPLMTQDQEHYITSGVPADNSIILPISGLSSESKVRPGLNVEKMLERMRDMVDSKKEFDLDTRNCSFAVGSVLEAGADNHLKHLVNPKALGGGIATPQATLNGAVAFHVAVVSNKGELTNKQKVNHLNPLRQVERAGGGLMRDSMSSNKSPAARARSASSLALMSPIVGVAAGLNKIGSIVSNRVRGASFSQNNTVANHIPKSSQVDSEISIGNNDISGPRSAVKAFIHSVSQGKIAAFDDSTMKQVNQFLNTIDTNNTDNVQLLKQYDQASIGVINLQKNQNKEAVNSNHTVDQNNVSSAPSLSALANIMDQCERSAQSDNENRKDVSNSQGEPGNEIDKIKQSVLDSKSNTLVTMNKETNGTNSASSSPTSSKPETEKKERPTLSRKRSIN